MWNYAQYINVANVDRTWILVCHNNSLGCRVWVIESVLSYDKEVMINHVKETPWKVNWLRYKAYVMNSTQSLNIAKGIKCNFG